MEENQIEEEKGPKDKGSWKKAARILGYMRPYKWRYFLGLLFLFLTGLVFLSFTQLMQYLVDGTGIQNNLPYEIPFDLDIKNTGIILILVLLAQTVFSFFRIYLFSYVTEHSLADYRRDAYNRLITLPMTFFTKRSAGELNSRMASDISQIQEVMNTTLAEFLRQFVIIIGGVVILVGTSPKLTGIMVLIVPVIALSAVFFGRFIRKLSRAVQDEVAESTHIVEETVTGIVNVKAFTNELFEARRFSKSVDNIKRLAIKSGVWRGAFASFIILCVFGVLVGVMWYAMILVQNGELSYGQMFKFLLLAMTMGFSVGGMAELYAALQKGVGATERVLEIIDEPSEDLEIEANAPAIPLSGEIKFDHVQFEYPNRTDVRVLSDVTFTVLPGQQVAIVGPSGAGKSTITALVLRFYDPVGGKILFDGKDARDYDLTSLRKHMAVVPQEVLLFGGSIKENIAYGKPDATDEEVMHAADQANALEFIDRFPEKFETLVGDRGVQLSGGQRQRIAIARAVLKNPTILILDEATSSLDSESERLVQDALDKLMKGRTSIVIAHRLSTIRNANKILVLENGKLKEEGTHDELIAQDDGLYKHLSQLQFEV